MNVIGKHAALDRYSCPGCGYTYDQRHGEPHEGFAPGTPFAELPPDLSCPDCGVRDLQDFLPAEGAQTSPRT